MTTQSTDEDIISLPDAPAIPGLRFRHFRGDSDFPLMVAVLEASGPVDQPDHIPTVEELAHRFSNLKNCDPYQDVLVAEIAGRCADAA